MIKTRRAWVALSAIVVSAVMIVGCGGGGGGSTSTVADESISGAVGPAGTAVVKVASWRGRPGGLVVDADGMTVYEFRRDNPMLYQFNRNPIPTCYGPCAVMWLPLLTDQPPRAADGAEASKLGTIRRKDGGTQVTYDDHPLYVFTGDKRPGEMNGQDVHSFGARWYAVQSDGSELTP